jgi:hypothetical protein
MLFKGLMTSLATMALSVPAWAEKCEDGCSRVPEVSSNGSLAAIVAVAALAAILIERRRRA